MKNSNDNIEDRPRDLPACSAVPQPTALQRIPHYFLWDSKNNCLLFNPLNAGLNPICHLLALLVAHPIFHVSRIRVKDRL